jgi:hypothetical protein
VAVAALNWGLSERVADAVQRAVGLVVETVDELRCTSSR